ncbi:hypothetical protein, partial [Propionibacterium freudenreichii]|uniref:hypothetical protein n=1 Tax=Propionibacterium freudenreichii TaxID=1744 RepID=UPI00254CBBEA
LQGDRAQRVHAVESNSVAVVPAVLVVAVLPPAHASTEIELPDREAETPVLARSLNAKPSPSAATGSGARSIPAMSALKAEIPGQVVMRLLALHD